MRFLDLRQLSIMALVTAIVLVGIGVYKLMQEIKAFYFAILGFGVMAFLDIWKYNFFFNQSFYVHRNYDWAIYWTFIAFFVFLLFHSLKSVSIRIPNIEISKLKTTFIAIPFSLVILVYYVSVIVDVDVHSTSHSIFHLISFFPKACAVLLFYLFIRHKKLSYLIWFLIFVGLSFTEGTRRVYITMFLTCFAMIYAYILERKGKIYGKYKLLVLACFIGIFFYMNFLRADVDTGKGYEEGHTLNNTINYMMQLRALDTYDNTAFILSRFPERYDFFYGETYYALFVQFVPRIFWEKKPVGLGGPLGLMRTAKLRFFTKQKWITSGRGISLSPGFVGEAYANFGVFGIFLMSALFGLVTKFFDTNVDSKEVLKNPVQMANTAWYGSFFLLLRGDLVAALYYSMLFYLFLWIWILVLRK